MTLYPWEAFDPDDERAFADYIEEADAPFLPDDEDEGADVLEEAPVIDPRPRRRLPGAARYGMPKAMHDTESIPVKGNATRTPANPMSYLFFGVIGLLSVALFVALFFSRFAGPSTSAALPLPTARQTATTTVTPRPTETPAPTPLVEWTNEASWTPTGDTFAMAEPMNYALINRRGSRCQIRLPADTSGNFPEPWIPCQLLTEQ